MPPVRWQIIISVILLCISIQKARGGSMHDPISMSSDGWRPIIGKSQLEIQDEITLYKNPTLNSENSEPVKAESPPVHTPSTSTSTKPYQTITDTSSSNSVNVNHNNKPAAKAKHQKPFHLMHGHGPHIPLTPMGYKGSPLRIPIPNKHVLHMIPRPIRGPHGPAISHSMRNEVILPSPSAAIGSFAFFNPPGLSKKPFPVLHAPSDVVLQHIPVQAYLLQNRNPVQIDAENFFNQNDEYTRNLVPPPYKEQQLTKEKVKTEKPKERPTAPTEPASTINNPTLIIGKHKDRIVPDNIVVQLPPTFEPSQFELHGQKNHRPTEVLVTKEKLNVFHNSIPSNYNPTEEYLEAYRKPTEDTKIFSYEISEPIKQEIHLPKKQFELQPIFHHSKHGSFQKVSTAPHFPTYEVTEGKQWQEPPPPFLSTRPSVPKPPSPETNIVFLPTPYRPDSSVPTSASQNEVASIYSKVNLRNRQHENEQSTINPNYFDIKEVSTHYPIVGKPETPTILSVPSNSENTDFPNDITVINDEKSQPPQIYQYIEESEPTTPPTTLTPVRDLPPQRQRINTSHRRRRPLYRTTTEEPAVAIEEYSFVKTQSSEEQNHSDEMQKPKRRRRPARLRTTTTTTEIPQLQSSTRQKPRIKYETHRIRPSTISSEEDIPTNHKLAETFTYSVMQPVRETFVNSEIVHPSADLPINQENEVTKMEMYEENQDETASEHELAEQTEPVVTTTFTEATTFVKQKSRHPTITSVVETQPTTVHTTAFDHHTSQFSHFEPSKEAITIQEVYSKETEKPNTESTTAVPSSTTTETSTLYKIRRTRPIYDNKNRPRFSVKEYRQRLNQYSSTSSTETPRSTTESIRARFPSRSRKPINYHQEEETTERTKFTPKEPRYSTNSEAPIEKKVNTRLRPFGRQRSTTEATTTTQRISIKPNIFSNLRRPPPITLKQRIYNKYNRTQERTTEKDTAEEVSEATVNYDQPDASLNVIQNKVLQVDNSDDQKGEEAGEDYANTELMRNDALLQSQRVSDLTSSAHKEYETPGLFKSVSPNSRIVPSYFTLSTDDPILPIEAFFTNLKDRSIRNES